MSCGVGHRYSSDPALQWLWCRLAAAAPIQPPAWKPPYAPGAALKKTKDKKKKKKEAKESEEENVMVKTEGYRKRSEDAKLLALKGP